MGNKVYNFNAGPSMLPREVLQEAQQELLDYHDSGISILEASHRGSHFSEIHEEAIHNLQTLLAIPDEYSVLLLQGGASMQFAMVPMNFLGQGKTADYVHSGAWAAKAISEAQCVGKVHLAGDSSKSKPCRMPDLETLRYSSNPAYVHITSNETIEGTQWMQFPHVTSPLVVDMSSDILSKCIDVSSCGIIYAGAQKNLAPAGVTVVIINKKLAEESSYSGPKIWSYKTHIKNNSLYNTPPCFSIYMLGLVTRRMLKAGGVKQIQIKNEQKSKMLYEAIDATSFYSGTAHAHSRSNMNITFRLPSVELEESFLQKAESEGLIGLKGHRSVGGIRASIYNPFPLKGIQALIAFMKDFESENG